MFTAERTICAAAPASILASPTYVVMMRTVAEIVATRRVQIVERWLDDARRAASARGLRRPELANMIPVYVATLGRSTSAEPPTDEQRALLQNHLSHRLRQGFDLHEVVVEFSVLVRVLRDVLEGLAAEERPSEEDVAGLFHELHAAVSVVTAMYTEHMAEDEQLEKRYGRLIQQVVSDAVHSDNGGTIVRRRLGEILGLVREALAADAAALLLYDAATDRLTMTASNGFDEPPVGEPTGVASSSFVGAVLLDRKALAVRDTEDGRFALDERLRGAGMRSLLGVPLVAVQSVVGVMYVAARGVRDFSPSDIRRLESLGDRIALHLDNAQLSARLRDKIAQLELFVDVLAHDLRGPLGTALLATGTLGHAGEERSASLQRLERSLHRIDQMVTDLLDAHRIAAGEALSLRAGDAQIERIATDVVEALDPRQRGRVAVGATGQTRGTFDAELVRRAVWNLVVNALKYGAADALVNVDINGDEHGFVVAVHNEGPPIPLAEQKTLFKPFARAGGAHAGGAKPGGWGLGLSLVAGCAAAHRGAVSVDSGAGGTTFRLTIPWQAASTHEASPIVH